MEPNDTRLTVRTAPFLAMSATAHNGLEKLSIRLAEIHTEGGKFTEKECETFLNQLKAAQTALTSCSDLVNAMRIELIEVRTLLDENEDANPSANASPRRESNPEDEMFPAGDVSDTLSGLPGRSIAIRAIQSALSVGRPRYACIFSIDRLRYLSSRYGTDAGQQAIRLYGQHLRTRMPSDTMLFRWGGGCFLGLFDLSGPIGDARAVVEQVRSQKVKLNFESDVRSALLSLTSACLAISFSSVAYHLVAIQEIDTFIDNHSCKQTD